MLAAQKRPLCCARHQQLKLKRAHQSTIAHHRTTFAPENSGESSKMHKSIQSSSQIWLQQQKYEK
jgi:hypothetical protein